jgi:hypothetical protein
VDVVGVVLLKRIGDQASPDFGQASRRDPSARILSVASHRIAETERRVRSRIISPRHGGAWVRSHGNEGSGL